MQQPPSEFLAQHQLWLRDDLTRTLIKHLQAKVAHHLAQAQAHSRAALTDESAARMHNQLIHADIINNLIESINNGSTFWTDRQPRGHE